MAEVTIDGLRRHALVRIGAAGWQAWLQRGRADGGLAWDAATRACLLHWSAHDWPLVVARQAAADAGAALARVVALGLPAPARWGRRRFSLLVEAEHLLPGGELPAAAAIAAQLPAAARPAWNGLCTALAALGVDARVYGSHGWQRITGMAYLHPASDIDLRLAVDDDAMADAATAALAACDLGGPRIDGELAFADGRDIAWREWLRARAGAIDCVLVKRIDGAALEPAGRGRRDAGTSPPARLPGSYRSAPAKVHP
jgi:phosphoribosyl-dephospho-CoA transferase